MISVFDMLKWASDHLALTVGPMKAGKEFVDDLVSQELIASVTRVAVDVWLLSLTSKGHHTDITKLLWG